MIAICIIWFYPFRRCYALNVPFIFPQWRIDPAKPIGYLWFIATASGAWLIFFLRRFFGRSVEVAALFFLTTLGPLLGFTMLYTFRFTFVADHYQYLACIGPIALAAAGLARIGGSRRNLHWLVVAVAG